MMIFLYVIAFFISVSILILVHESGHFLVARLFQVKVERFSIGFGKPFYSWKSKNGFTEYSLAPFILGGYVKLLDTRETKTPTKYWPFAFDRKPIIQRLAIISAGPMANILFAFFAFWLMFVIGFKLPKPIVGIVIPQSIVSIAGMHSGEEIIQVEGNSTGNWGEVIIAMLARIGDKGDLNITTKSEREITKTFQLDLGHWKIDAYAPDPLMDFGIEQYKPLVLPILYEVTKNSPADKYGLQKGDYITAVAGKKINSWEEFLREIRLYPKKKINLEIERAGKNIDLSITTGWKFGKGWKRIGFIGANVDIDKIVWPQKMLRAYHYNVIAAFPVAMHQMSQFIMLNNIIFGKLILGKISLGILGGPIATFTASGQALEHGFVSFLGFLAMISLSIALVNLLPLPGLDGGHLILFLIEAVRQRPVSMRVQLLIFRLGLALFIFIILQTTANDLIRMFG